MSKFFTAGLGLVSACVPPDPPHDHSSAHPTGHDHHAPGHGHGDVPVVSQTLWSDRFELFVEHPNALVGRELSWLAHVTVLDGFAPLERGQLSLELSGPATLRCDKAQTLRPGVFRLSATPEVAGTYRGTLRVAGELEGAIDGLVLKVQAKQETGHGRFHGHDHGHDVDHDEQGDGHHDEQGDGHHDEQGDGHHDEQGDGHHEDETGLIEFLKEQQWGVPFATAFVETGTVVASVEVPGRIATPPSGTAEVGASVAGRLIAPPKGLPRPGASVRKGQVLASFMPAPSSPEGAARAGLSVTEAQARAAAAKRALARAERLIQDEAISKRELEDAQQEVQVAEAAVRSAQRAVEMFAGAVRPSGPDTWRLVAPIDGIVVSVRATPGAVVSPGETLFRIVDPRELWVVAQVPEQDAARLRPDRGASFQLAGLDTWRPIPVAQEGGVADAVIVGRAVDPVSRTVEVIYRLPETDASLRVGGLVRVGLPVGDAFQGVVIPRGALIDRDGRSAVYVQVDGEHFLERLVKLGPRAGDRLGIASGLRAGERLVTRGAHLVRLAERASGPQAHGHIH